MLWLFLNKFVISRFISRIYLLLTAYLNPQETVNVRIILFTLLKYTNETDQQLSFIPVVRDRRYFM